MQNSQVYIRSLVLHKLVLSWAFQRAAAPTLQVELPMASAMASNPDLAVGEECQKADLDTVMWEGARRLDLKAATIMPEAVAATRKVHRP
jgi:hypothetical protein